MYLSINEVDAAQLAQWLEGQNDIIQVVDVREIREIVTGTIPNALAVPLATLPMRLKELNREQTLVIICRSGARSAQACMFLQQQGFDDVHNLRGGVLAWSQNSLPIVRPEVA